MNIVILVPKQQDGGKIKFLHSDVTRSADNWLTTRTTLARPSLTQAVSNPVLHCYCVEFPSLLETLKISVNVPSSASHMNAVPVFMTSI